MSDGISVGPLSQPAFLPAGASLTGEPIRFIGKEMFLKVAGASTGGTFTILEDVSPPKSGPPLHSHTFEEWFYILEGEFLFEIEGNQTPAHAGDILHVAPNLPHTFQNKGEHDGRILVVAKPAGVETYFVELAERMMSDPANLPALSAIGSRYGVTLLGPPMAARVAG